MFGEYNLQHHPFGAIVTWRVTPAAAFVTSSGTGTAAGLRARINYRATATLTFTITGGCGTTTVSRAIGVGAPAPASVSRTSAEIARGGIVAISTSSSGVTWSVSSGLSVVSQSSTNISVTGETPGNYTVTARRSNNCGTTNKVVSIKVLSSGGGDPGGPGGPLVIVYPNPVDDVLTIESTKVNSLSATATTSATATYSLTASGVGASDIPTPFSIKLFDSRQHLIREAASTGKKIQLDIRTLSPGIYFLHVHSQEGTLQRQIVVE